MWWLPLSFLFVEDAEASEELIELLFEGRPRLPGGEVEYVVLSTLPALRDPPDLGSRGCPEDGDREAPTVPRPAG